MTLWVFTLFLLRTLCVIFGEQKATGCLPEVQVLKEGQSAQLDFELQKAVGDFTVRKYNITNALNEIPGEEILFVRLDSMDKCKVNKPYEDIQCYRSSKNIVTLVIPSFTKKHEGLYQGDRVGKSMKTDNKETVECTLKRNGTLATTSCDVSQDPHERLDVTCHFNAFPHPDDTKPSFFVKGLEADAKHESAGNAAYCHYVMEGTYYRCSDDKINWFNASVKRDEESLSTSVTVAIKHKADTIGFSCQPTAKPAHVTIQEHPCFLPHTGHYAKGDSAIRGCSTALLIIIFLCIAVTCVILRGPNQTSEEGQGEQQHLCIRQRFRNFFRIKTLIAVLTVLFVILLITSLVTMVLSYTVLG